MIETMENAGALATYSDADVISFADGLLGYESCTRFVVAENRQLTPLHILQSVDQPEVSFLVLDPRILVPNYYQSIPSKVWRSIDVTKASQMLALVTAVITSNIEDCSANLASPLVINYETMKATQVILTDSQYSVMHPMISRKPEDLSVKAAVGSSSR